MVTMGGSEHVHPPVCDVVDMADEDVAYHIVGLKKWARDVSANLRAGYAEITTLNNHGVSMPIPSSLVVGGWPAQQPCCEDGCAPDPERSGIAPQTDAALEQWECRDCGDNRAPLVWATMPLVPTRDCPDAATHWDLPAPAEAAAAADLGWERWTDLRQDACCTVATATAGQLRDLFEAAPADAITAAEGLVFGVGLFLPPDDQYPLGVHVEWGPARSDGGLLQVGYYEPLPVPRTENEGRWGGFRWEFEPVESVAVSAAAATRLWQPEWVHETAPDITPDTIRRQWARGHWGPTPPWLTPTDEAGIAAVAQDLQERAQGVRRGRGIEL